MKLKMPSPKSLLAGSGALCMIVLFNNCSGGYQTQDTSSLSSSNSTSETQCTDPTGFKETKGQNVAPSKPDADGYMMVWRDEFDGSELNLKYWEYEIDGDGGGNNELQYYTDSPKNTSVKNGLLTLKLIKEDVNRFGKIYSHSSSRIRSKGRASWRYGKFEIRAKISKGVGVWPAIWMLPESEVYGSWPLSGEIDILEIRGREPQTLMGTLHFGQPWPNNQWTDGRYSLSGTDFSEGFHVFSVVWEPELIKWYVDGVLYSTKTPADLRGQPWRFDQNFYLILNLAFGGGFDNNQADLAITESNLYIDYVRVYQKK
ncbi:hypothetical protein AZI86_11555 [Bdellovibrio bacteriovorus]|uniref:GH16 domain-containing protein n=1 Tax=Bdellovibrio bacteriovorus TaxID=959 RepID=A0A150WLE5_BDEBC|nr:glycoside hydrolase family 16 protein [Bdellovibrio bacteriovorus]KYG64831.1 hypothetical protein AZI86_11555 [Bdellovibrio bacteriovorus]